MNPVFPLDFPLPPDFEVLRPDLKPRDSPVLSPLENDFPPLPLLLFSIIFFFSILALFAAGPDRDDFFVLLVRAVNKSELFQKYLIEKFLLRFKSMHIIPFSGSCPTSLR